jgi:hypothetical protein
VPPAPFQPDPFAPRVSPIVAPPVVVPSPSQAREVAQAPVFDAPVEEPARKPSEFTMFLNRDQLRALLPPDPAGGAAPAAGGGSAPAFAPPAFPAPPAFKVAPPAVPIPAPKPPAAPAIAAPAAAPAGSMLPLITVLVVLVAIGALLVMYFVMKH